MEDGEGSDKSSGSSGRGTTVVDVSTISPKKYSRTTSDLDETMNGLNISNFDDGREGIMVSFLWH